MDLVANALGGSGLELVVLAALCVYFAKRIAVADWGEGDTVSLLQSVSALLLGAVGAVLLIAAVVHMPVIRQHWDEPRVEHQQFHESECPPSQKGRVPEQQ